MPDEKPAPLPLTGEEVQQAVLFKIAESFEKTCHLRYDNAYTSFSAEVTIKLTLSDYGRQVSDNHYVQVAQSKEPYLREAGEADKIGDPGTLEYTVKVEPAPPNQVRVETGQDVPVEVVENGRRRIKHVKYAARKARPKLDKEES